MDHISAFAGQRLEWLQPNVLSRAYELQAGPAQLAALSFNSAWGTLATAETADGTWTFKRVGFLNPRVTVRVAGSPDNLAVYHPKFWGDGDLIFPDGASFHFLPINFWATQWTFAGPGNLPLVRFSPGPETHRVSDLFKTQVVVELGPADPFHPAIPLLVTLGWYLIILHQDDAAAASIAGATAAMG